MANSRTPKSKQRNSPFLKIILPLASLLAPSASAIKGVIAVENPIPKDIAINIKLFPNETAASSAAPSWPTIILSINATVV